MGFEITAIVGEASTGKTGGEQYDARLLEAAKRTGIQVDYITWEQSVLDRWMSAAIVWRFRDISRTLWLTWKVWRSSGDVFIDVWMAPYLILWATFSNRHITLMVHHLRAHLESGGLKQAWIAKGETLLVNRAAHILTVSRSSQQQIQGLLKHDVNIDIIPPGFERHQVLGIIQQQKNTETVFLFVGHLTKAKGVLDLVKAAALLDKKVAWKLYIVGSATAESETATTLQQLNQEYDLQSRIELCGRVSGEELQALYQMADIFVLPSYWEGYGIVFLEAMAEGLPVISTTAGAIPEVVIDGETGLLVEPGDVKALSLAMEKLLLSEEERQLLGQQGQQTALVAPDWKEVEKRFDAWWLARVEDAA